MSEDSESPASKVDIDWVRTAAAALAAVSSAVLLSTVGAVGTIIGAALGSVVASVGTAVYAQGLARSKARVARAQDTAMQRIALAQGEVRRAQRPGTSTLTSDAHLEQAEADLEAAGRQLDDASEDAQLPPWRERLAALPWKRIGIFAAGIFLVTVVVISAFELTTGRSVSSYTGGSDSSRSTFFGGGSSSQDQPAPREQQEPPSDGPSAPEQTPDDEATSPSEDPSPSDEPGPADDSTTTPSPTEPSESSDPTTEVPTEVPSPTAPTPTG